jgi:hypothetical protein
LGIGDWGLGPIPNPQSPIPNPQSPKKTKNLIIFYLFSLNKNGIILIKKSYRNKKIKRLNTII